MKNGLKLLAILTLAASAGAAGQVFANCVNEGPYEVRQCANSTWFAAPPAGSGFVTGQWWGVGFGNANGFTTTTNPDTGGSGFLPTPLPGVFAGIDSGTLPVIDPNGGVTLDLVDATTIAGIGAPPGSLCFSSRANWGSPGIDSCIDVNRNATAGGGASSVSDNYVNKYWDAAPNPDPYAESPYYLYLNHQLDPPMGVLLKEGTGQFFAAAFFATVPKVFPRDHDLDPGQYHMGKIVNGGPNASNVMNVVPWQKIPKGNVSAVLVDPQNPSTSLRNITFDFSAPGDAPVLITDDSTRPCLLTDNTTPCSSLGGANGVGVNDQGSLIHYVVETAGLDATDPNHPVCLTNWTPVPGASAEYPATVVVANGIAPDSCVRLRTGFGKTPTSAMRTAATTANRDANRLDAQQGKLGDLGYSIVSSDVKVGGPLVSMHARLTSVSKEKNNLRVVFDTDTESNVTGFDVVGIDGKGGRKVIGTVACQQCTSGLSASYDELIPGVKLQGAKGIQIVAQPSGVQSNTLALK